VKQTRNHQLRLCPANHNFQGRRDSPLTITHIEVFAILERLSEDPLAAEYRTRAWKVLSSE
jgi:hypothetical protein